MIRNVALAIVWLLCSSCSIAKDGNVNAVTQNGGAANGARSQPNVKEADSEVGQEHFCRHDPKSNLPCANTVVPEPKNVDEFWQKFMALLSPVRGYVLPKDAERAFGIHFAKSWVGGDGHRISQYTGSGALPLSIQLDSYPAGFLRQIWQRDQGELSRPHSILNISGGNFGCISVPEAEKKMASIGFVVQGSIIYKFIGLGRSITILGDPNRPTTITLYYGQAVLAEPCVLSIRVDAYK
ncbi:hypothetical protein DWU98_21095 [Dyella monticola]|uniref:Uncharacterized protein n=1 Tax=Dyella monticola TaxID=1927958 RepID=A0A370WS84_9GAMM|nr:hypothetical protein [Dyella monticola]RDS78805.1 hypothetical protein DWU98_21095 [Dyella monticola]